MRDLSLSFEGNEVSCLESPYAICASVKQQFQLYISVIYIRYLATQNFRDFKYQSR